MDKTINLIFSREPGELLNNVKRYLGRENLKPVSLNIVREYNNFCALVTGEKNVLTIAKEGT